MSIKIGYIRFVFVALWLVFMAQSLTAAGVTLQVRNRSAESVFREIMKQTGKNFVYKSGTLDGIRVTVSVTDVSLEKALERIFDGTDITYRINGNSVILKREAAPDAGKTRPQTNFTISGFVRDSADDEAVVGANIRDIYSGRVAATNSAGFYSITVPAGKVCLQASSLGSEVWKSDVLDVLSNVVLNIRLNPARVLDEVVVTATVNNSKAINSAEIGSLNLNAERIKATPVVFGESDVVKTLQLEPGVSAGVEGMAGMYVHGGDTDENLYMLDNVPLYQVNHFGGLFSAFNAETIRNVDFYKSSFPAKYDGRLSSFMDVNTLEGDPNGHHGSFRLGLTSGAININGPLFNDKTTYLVGVRRSWFELLTIPGCAIANKLNEYDDSKFRYAFTDVNLRLTHRFSSRSRGYVMFYYGEDFLKYSYSDEKSFPDSYTKDSSRLRWGNIVASAGWNYMFAPGLYGELTAAYTRYSSNLKSRTTDVERDDDGREEATVDELSHRNNINDWIFRADFDWHPTSANKLSFGLSYTLHSFLPSLGERQLVTPDFTTTLTEDVKTMNAGEINAYVGDDLQIGHSLRLNAGLHWSLFRIDSHTHQSLNPRFSFRWLLRDNLAVKGGYSRTSQYVHQLSESSISLPTDQWIPITGNNKPQTADKVAAAVDWTTDDRQWTVSLEGYWKWMHNLLDYVDEYYLIEPDAPWEKKMTPGRGRARGIDLKVTREWGKVTGHVAYSLLWADRQFDNKNGGLWFPARYDNRHKINIALYWKISDKWEVGATWTGMSGNRITLPLQCWNDPYLGPWHFDMDYAEKLNNYRLPFYHRLDLSATRHTRRGYWTFSLYNAYCNMNVIAVRRDSSYEGVWVTNPATGYRDYVPKNTFQKVRLLPVIPSVSYTWLF